MSSRQDLIATYLADLGDDALRAAEAFATGQSIGTWLPVPGITPEMQAEHGARVVEVRPLAEGETIAGEPAGRAEDGDRPLSRPWLLRVAFPVVNFGPQFPMLFTTLLGNDPSTSLTVRLVAIDLPPPFLDAFGGPRAGIDGWRRLTGVTDRPLLLNMIKPCTGYPPEVGADFVEAAARGGCDLVKDDELLADPSFSRVAERAQVYRRRLDEVADETGHRAWYVANVTNRARSLLDTAQAALAGGAGAVMVNALAVGPDLVQALAEANLGAPILAHMAGIETFSGGATTGFGRALLVGRLMRLAGADAVLTDNPYGRRSPSEGVIRATIEWLREPWGSTRAALPVVGGGLTGAMLAPIVTDFGIELMFGVGGAIQGHPEGATVGARTIRAAIDHAVREAAR
ncbi:MAG: RuBisCO large subunit C-terminal-like domain-containing protein [Candidatus Limnocylindria bacterium]